MEDVKDSRSEQPLLLIVTIFYFSDPYVKIYLLYNDQRIAKKNWPHGLPRTGLHSRLYHNHSQYSGNVPAWASWEWPKSTKGKMGKFECHFFCLVTGIHPAFSVNGKCRRLECRGYSRGSIFEHHFFECENSKKNRNFFKAKGQGA